MKSNAIAQTAQDVEKLFKTMIEMYEAYFKTLEAFINATPDTDVTRLQELNALAEEAHEALQADIATFEKAIQADEEGLAGMNDELKIQSLYDKLKQ
jgi:hypothetical protein